MSRLRAIHRLLPLLACAIAACDRQPPEEPRLLVVDGIEIRRDEVEPFVAFLDSFLPEGGRKTKIARVLDEYLLPLRLAQRAFPAEREQLRARAQALADVAGNVAELEQHSALIETRRRSTLTRTRAMLPIAMRLFDPLQTGAVGPPIEVPQGWFVVGAYDLVTSPGLALEDAVDALQVGFVTHTAVQWREWLEAQKQAIADKVTFVHPDHHGALPAWLRPPRLP